MRFHEPNGDEQKWNEAKNRKQIERKEKKKNNEWKKTLECKTISK